MRESKYRLLYHIGEVFAWRAFLGGTICIKSLRTLDKEGIGLATTCGMPSMLGIPFLFVPSHFSVKGRLHQVGGFCYVQYTGTALDWEPPCGYSPVHSSPS